MTTKPPTAQPAAGRRPPMPDPPRKYDMQENTFFEQLAVGNTLGRHLGAFPHRQGSTTLASGEGYLCRERRELQQAGQTCQPDLLVAFNVDAEAIVANRGYVISEVRKSPELALEIASATTGRRDYIAKRPLYAGFGVKEYWRYDHTGGQYHDAPLAGDRLTPEGGYRPIELHTEPDGVIWGYSEVLELSLCWVPGNSPDGYLRFWDHAAGRYLREPAEEAAGRIAERAGRLAERDARLAAESQVNAERDARLAAESQVNAERDARLAAESQVSAERDARLAAETRIQQLEEELRRRESP